jgi:hypothetical protein
VSCFPAADQALRPTLQHTLNSVHLGFCTLSIPTSLNSNKHYMTSSSHSNGTVSDFPGCVIAELFTEGVPLFDLSQLLAYRNGHFFPEQVLNKIEDRSIRDLVTMLQIRAIEFYLTMS